MLDVANRIDRDAIEKKSSKAVLIIVMLECEKNAGKISGHATCLSQHVTYLYQHAT